MPKPRPVPPEEPPLPAPSSLSSSSSRSVGRGGRRRFFLLLLWVPALAVVVGAAFYAGRVSMTASGALEAVQGRVKLKPGPWGEVEYLPITIAAPRRLLKVQGIENEPVRWFFRGRTRADMARLLEGLRVSPEVREKLLGSSTKIQDPAGLLMEPPCDAVRSLKPFARKELYEILARDPENGPTGWEFQSKFVATFEKYGVRRGSVAALEDFSVRHGKYMVTYCMPCVLAAIPDHEEKTGLMKALTQQPSMLVRLKITPKTDVQALAAYWGRSMWTTDVEAILESLHMRPDGGSINILELLPPQAAALLHSYPVPHNFMNGPEVVKNCSWTAFNFFRDTPNPDFANEDYMLKVLAEDYYPVLSDPQYGDIATFLTPEGRMKHVAVYLADDLYFTKNGENPWHPWVYSTASDMMETFSFGLPEGQQLSIHFFRSKNY